MDNIDHMIESTGCCNDTEPREMPRGRDGVQESNINFLGIPINELQSK